MGFENVIIIDILHPIFLHVRSNKILTKRKHTFMKNLILIFSLLLVFTACKKDNAAPEKVYNLYRIKTFDYKSEDGNEDLKVDFTYDNNQLSKVNIAIFYNGEWLPAVQYFLTYEGSKAILLREVFDSKKWHIQSKSEYRMNGERVTEESFFIFWEGRYYKEWMWKYKYNGEQLIAWESFEKIDENAAFVIDARGEFIYEEGNLVAYNAYEKINEDTWKHIAKEEIIHAGDQITNRLVWALDEMEILVRYINCKYFYINDDIVRSDYHIWNNTKSDWESQPAMIKDFEYDSAGFLSYETNGFESSSYTYEEGHGNAKIFLYYPEDLVFNEPTFKDSDVEIEKLHTPYYERFITRLNNQY
jgi:hypothetical protein